MKPRTSLILSVSVLLVTFVGARLYVGSQLDQFKEQQDAAQQPVVNVVDMPSKPAAPAAPHREPTEAELAEERVSGAFGAFTALVELTEEDRAEELGHMVAGLESLDTPTMLAVPQARRVAVEQELQSIGESLPADALAARRAFQAKRLELLKTWGSDTAAAQEQLEALSGSAQ